MEKIKRHWYESYIIGKCNPENWCKYCNCNMQEHEKHWIRTDKDMFHDYVIVHGLGKPTEKGYEHGLKLLEKMDYADASAHIVFLGLTTKQEESE